MCKLTGFDYLYKFRHSLTYTFEMGFYPPWDGPGDGSIITPETTVRVTDCIGGKNVLGYKFPVLIHYLMEQSGATI